VNKGRCLCRHFEGTDSDIIKATVRQWSFGKCCDLQVIRRFFRYLQSSLHYTLLATRRSCVDSCPSIWLYCLDVVPNLDIPTTSKCPSTAIDVHPCHFSLTLKASTPVTVYFKISRLLSLILMERRRRIRSTVGYQLPTPRRTRMTPTGSGRSLLELGL
jgi:hypothetical protein